MKTLNTFFVSFTFIFLGLVPISAMGQSLPAGYQLDDLTCPTCSDGVRNGDELGVDCDGSCEACHCDNGVQDPDEDGIDWYVFGTAPRHASKTTALYRFGRSSSQRGPCFVHGAPNA